MAKIFLVLVIALFVTQGTNAASLQKYQPLSALGDVVQELSQKLQEIATDVDDRVSKLSEDFADKFNTILTEANFEEIVSNLREEVTKLNSDKPSCEETANNEIKLLEELINKQKFTCKYEVDVDLNNLKNKFEQLAIQVQQLKKEVARDVFVCMKESRGNLDKYGKCLKEKVENIKTKMEEVENAFLKTVDEVQNAFDFVLDKISDCVLEAKKDVETKAENIIDNLKSCVQGTPQTRKVQNPIFDVIDEMQKIVDNVNSRILSMADNFKIQFDKIIKEANFDKIFSDLKDKVKSSNSKDVCQKTALKEIEMLEKLVKEQTYTCKYDVNQDVNGLTQKLEKLIRDVYILNSKFVKDIFFCNINSQGNEEKYNKCLNDEAASTKVKLEEIKKEVDETLNEVEKAFDFVMQKVFDCVVEEKTDVEGKAQLIIDNLNKCNEQSQNTRIAKVSVIDELNKEMNQIIHEVNIRLFNMAQEFDEQLKQLIQEAGFDKIISDLHDEVAKLNSENQSINLCGETAINEIEALEKLIKQQPFVCKFEVDADLTGLKNKLESLVKQAVGLNNEFVQDIFVCMKESNGNLEKYNKCFEEKAAVVKSKLKDLETIVSETLDEVEKAFDLVMDKVTDCVLEAKKDVEDKAKTVVDNLKSCIDSAATTRNSVTIKIPEEVSNLSDKINIIIADNKIVIYIAKLTKQIEEILAQTDKNAKECRVEALDKVTNLIKDSELGLQKCALNVEETTKDLQHEFQILSEKSAVLSSAMRKIVFNCAQLNRLNLEGFSKCVKDRSEALDREIAELQNEADKFVNLAKDTVKNVVETVTKCVQTVEDKTFAQGNVIVDDLKKCIRNLDLLF